MLVRGDEALEQEMLLRRVGEHPEPSAGERRLGKSRGQARRGGHKTKQASPN